MNRHDPKLHETWNQSKVPVFYREPKRPLLLRLPYSDSNREWIRAGRKAKPTWAKQDKHWEVPQAWFESLVRRALDRFGQVYVIQPFRPEERCAPACWNALGVTCSCQCMGAHHGVGNPAGKWHEVSETFAVSWGERQFSCRLLKPFSGTT